MLTLLAGIVVSLLFLGHLRLSREGLILAALSLGGIAIVLAQKTRRRER